MERRALLWEYLAGQGEFDMAIASGHRVAGDDGRPRDKAAGSAFMDDGTRMIFASADGM